MIVKKWELLLYCAPLLFCDNPTLFTLLLSTLRPPYLFGAFCCHRVVFAVLFYYRGNSFDVYPVVLAESWVFNLFPAKSATASTVKKKKKN